MIEFGDIGLITIAEDHEFCATLCHYFDELSNTADPSAEEIGMLLYGMHQWAATMWKLKSNTGGSGILLIPENHATGAVLYSNYQCDRGGSVLLGRNLDEHPDKLELLLVTLEEGQEKMISAQTLLVSRDEFFVSRKFDWQDTFPKVPAVIL